MVNEIDRKLNTYFINKETGKIFFNNVMFGNVWNVGTGYAVVFPLELSVDNLSRNTGVDIDPNNDYYVVPGYAIEMLIFTEARLGIANQEDDHDGFRQIDWINYHINAQFPYLDYGEGEPINSIIKHYVGMGDIDES